MSKKKPSGPAPFTPAWYWRQEARYVLGACVVEPAQTVVARCAGITTEVVPDALRPVWVEACRQGDLGYMQLDNEAMWAWLHQHTQIERAAYRDLMLELECDSFGRFLPQHAKQLRAAWLKLRLVALEQAQAAAAEVEDEDSYTAALAEAERVRVELRELDKPAIKWVDEVGALIEAASKPQDVVAVPTGIASLDEHLGGGLGPGWLAIVMGAAKAGKSALAINGIARAAMREGKRAMVVSLEMSRKEVIQRWLAAESGVPVRAMRRGDATHAQADALTRAGDEIARWTCDIRTSLTSVDTICAAVRGAARDGLDLVVVDYLQLITNGMENRVLDLERTTRGLKLLATELQVPIVLLSQPNNQDAKGGDPGLFSGKGSGSIAADCDVMLVPLRDNNDDTRAGLNLVGFRHGAPRRWELGSLTFSGSRMVFEEGAPVVYRGGATFGGYA